ncbi:hypothetical protein B5V89_10255 [Heyndrickxia sporothermodurans]|uniref:hypothetical protein n=1 Tax=Heyndrickxia TaxID=2837504 RepID=UPI000D3A62D9|nr:hypothetical protein [Heyndrickxia sporothermodurans]PTY78378.1 hypothetical protein B5V89_10255 [Heyndrickxia sporothermodurans]
MNFFSEKNFAGLKRIIGGRSNDFDDMYMFHLGTLIYTIFVLGLPYYAVFNWNAVGWSNFSSFWKGVAFSEGGLFVCQILLLLFCHKKNNINQKILSFSKVIYGYKIIIDPFVFISISAMDRGVFENIEAFLLTLFLLGILLHFVLLYRLIFYIKKGMYSLSDKEIKKEKGSLVLIIPIFLAMVVCSILLLTRYADFDIIFFLIAAIALFFYTGNAVCDYIMDAYCILRFPSFAVNPPPKQQYVKKKKRRKKKRR